MTDPFMQALFGAAMNQGWGFAQTGTAQGAYQGQFHQQGARNAQHPPPVRPQPQKPFTTPVDRLTVLDLLDPVTAAVAAGKIPPKSMSKGTYDTFLHEVGQDRAGPIRLVKYTINDDPDEP